MSWGSELKLFNGLAFRWLRYSCRLHRRGLSGRTIYAWPHSLPLVHEIGYLDVIYMVRRCKCVIQLSRSHSCAQIHVVPSGIMPLACHLHSEQGEVGSADCFHDYEMLSLGPSCSLQLRILPLELPCDLWSGFWPFGVGMSELVSLSGLFNVSGWVFMLFQ